jgi:mono/diheme cytochrome c family protein
MLRRHRRGPPLASALLTFALFSCAEEGEEAPPFDTVYETQDTGTPVTPASDAGPTNTQVSPVTTSDSGSSSTTADSSTPPVQIGPDGLPVVLPPPPYAIKVDPHPQPAGDPKVGYDYLVNGDYQRQGPALKAWIAASPKLTPRDTVPGRTPANAGLGYLFTAVKADNGSMVAGANCLACHASHLQGKLTVGLGRPNHMVQVNSSGGSLNLITILGTVIADPLGVGTSLDMILRLLPGPLMDGHHMNIFAELASHRDPKTLRWSTLTSFNSDSGLQGWVDFPPWWATKKKNALYMNGTGRGVKSHHLQLMSWFSVKDVKEAEVIQTGFNHVNAWMDTLEAPKFPGKIDAALADQGKRVYLATCAQCHGTYGATDAEDTYPNLIIPVKDVGTDPNLTNHHWMANAIPWYEKSWYGKDHESWFDKAVGYMPPPLDGVWATAPYFHNGSVPTLDAVINPKKRLAKWTSNNSDDDYDLVKVGWKDNPLDIDLINLDLLQRDINLGTYNTASSGNSNKGHTYGEQLDDASQKALLEYLKTL